jgi:hypothetical protein
LVVFAYMRAIKSFLIYSLYHVLLVFSRELATVPLKMILLI